MFADHSEWHSLNHLRVAIKKGSRIVSRGSLVMLPIILAGGFGGIAPHIARIAGACIGNPTIEAMPPFLSMIVYLGGMLLFAALGGGMAYITQETSPKSAFLMGIAAPALIASLVSSYQDAKSPQRFIFPSKVTTDFNFISFANAAQQPWSDKTQQTLENILASKVVLRLGDASTRLSVVALSEKAAQVLTHICFMTREDLVSFRQALKGKETPEINCVDQEFVRPKQNAFTTLLVPVGALAAMVNGELFAIDKSDTAVGVDLDAQPTFAGDVLWALGGNRTESILKSTAKELSK